MKYLCLNKMNMIIMKVKLKIIVTMKIKIQVIMK